MLFAAPVAMALFAVLAACDGGTDGTSASRPPDVRVFAAASLTGAFQEIAKSYSGRIEYNFAGSQVLRTQLDQGARADVFASADQQNMTDARRSGLISGDPVVFARNTLVVITPRDDRIGITTAADLAKPGVKLILGAPEVPVGRYSREAIEKLGAALGAGFSSSTMRNIVSGEEDVKRVLIKVQLGEADAGIVYASDVAGAQPRDGVRSFALPDSVQPDVAYYVAAVEGGNPRAARAFIDLLRGPIGTAALRSFGLIPVGQ